MSERKPYEVKLEMETGPDGSEAGDESWSPSLAVPVADVVSSAGNVLPMQETVLAGIQQVSEDFKVVWDGLKIGEVNLRR